MWDLSSESAEREHVHKTEVGTSRLVVCPLSLWTHWDSGPDPHQEQFNKEWTQGRSRAEFHPFWSIRPRSSFTMEQWTGRVRCTYTLINERKQFTWNAQTSPARALCSLALLCTCLQLSRARSLNLNHASENPQRKCDSIIQRNVAQVDWSWNRFWDHHRYPNPKSARNHLSIQHFIPNKKTLSNQVSQVALFSLITPHKAVAVLVLASVNQYGSSFRVW